MKKFYISYVVEVRGLEGGCREEEYENLFKCLIGEIEHFSELDEDFNEEEEDEESLKNLLDSIQSENCGEWMIISIIEEGKGVVYSY